jgi:hypothetical protein
VSFGTQFYFGVLPVACNQSVLTAVSRIAAFRFQIRHGGYSWSWVIDIQVAPRDYFVCWQDDMGAARKDSIYKECSIDSWNLRFISACSWPSLLLVPLLELMPSYTPGVYAKWVILLSFRTLENQAEWWSFYITIDNIILCLGSLHTNHYMPTLKT